MIVNWSHGQTQDITNVQESLSTVPAASGPEFLGGDTLGSSEAFGKAVFATRPETVSLGESLGIVKTFLRTIGDAVGLAEGFVKLIDKTIVDTVVLTESFVKTLLKPFAETVVLTENLATEINPAGPSGPGAMPVCQMSLSIGLRIG